MYCVRCAYNLRTLATEGNCPECNLPLACSLGTEWLQYADSAWLRRLSLGATFVLASFLAFSAGWLSAHAPAPVPAFAALLTEACGAFGAWLLTTPRQQSLLSGESQVLRVAVRVLYCGGVVFAAITGLSALVGRQLIPASVDPLLEGPILLLLPTRYVLLLVYLHRFARQIPGDAVAWSSGMVIGGIATCGGTLAVIFLLSLVVGTARTGWDEGTPLGGVVGCALPAIMVGFAVFGIWSIVLFVLYARRFGSMAKSGAAGIVPPPRLGR